MKKIFMYILFLFSFSSCKKFVEVAPPTTQLSAETIFKTDATATAAQLAIYAGMESDGLAYNQIINTGVSADEMVNYSTTAFNIDIATNNLTADNNVVLVHWTNFYKYIYQATAMLEGLERTASLSDAIKKQLGGESRFVRAFCNFYLMNLFGDIPLVHSTDYRINARLSRSTVSEGYTFVKQDLEEAISWLSMDYLDGHNNISVERVRPNKWAAKALLARVNLYTSQWVQAETEATAVIDNSGTYQLSPNPDEVFLKNSMEAIWQWQSIVPGYNSYPGAFLVLQGTPSVVSLDTNFVNSFHSSDHRKTSWIASITDGGTSYSYPYKYKVMQNAPAITEYTMVLRLSEQYLIRAEARAMQDNIPGAEQDLNMIRNRAGLSPLTGLSKQSLLDSIQQERKFELFAEFGDRWLNLKRTGIVTTVLSVVKGSNWNETDVLYPIPLSEINRNNNLTQNQGY